MENKKTYLITGGAGFIGSNFIHYVFKNYSNIKVINIDKLTYAANINNLENIMENPNHIFIKGDICNRELIEYIFELYKPDYIINFAAESHVDRSIEDPSLFMKTNILGTYTLLEVFKRYFEKNRNNKIRFLQISTDEVYGSLPTESKEKFTEDSPLKPNNPYSASKASADLIVKAYYKTYNLPVLITRSSNNFGPRQYHEKLIPLTIKKALNKEPIPIYGDGKNIRDWLYVVDNCKAIDLVLNKGKIGEIYNIGGENEWKNIDLVNFICEILSKLTKKDTNEYKKLITFVKDRPSHDRKYSLNIKKISDELDFFPSKNFENNLEFTIKWYFKNIFL